METNPSRPIALLKGSVLIAFPVAFAVLFFYHPLIEIFRVSFSELFGKAEIDWGRVFSVFRFTAFQALLSTVLTILLGLPAACIFGRYRFLGKRFLNALFSIPFILPTIVAATAFNALIGPKGWINLLMMKLNGLATPPIRAFGTLQIIIVAHIFYNISIVIRMVSAAWSGLDTRYEEAGRVLGYSGWTTFRKVVFPLLRPTLQSAALIVFLFDFTSYGVVLLLGGGAFRTVEVDISQQALMFLNLPMASTLSILQLIVTLGITLLDQLSSKTIAALRIPRVRGENQRKIQGFGSRLWISLYLFGLILFLGLPLIALVTRSFYLLPAEAERLGGNAGWTLTFFKQLFINERKSFFYVPPLMALVNSLAVGIGVGVLATLTGGLIVFAENRFPWTRRLEWLFMISIGTSAVTLGLGYLIAFRSQIRNPLLIVAAHGLIALPFAIRSLKPAFSAIPLSLRQSAAVSGANPFRTFLKVELPLMKNGLIPAFVFSMTISLGEFGASSFLSSPERPTIPIAIYRYLGQPGAKNFGQAMALSTILLLLCMLSVLAPELPANDRS